MADAGRRRVVAASLGLALALPLLAAAAQRDPEFEDGIAFVTFVQSVSARRAVMVCERGIPGYRQHFDDLYARWSAKHQGRVARGEAIYRELVSGQRPVLDRAKLQELEQAVRKLGEPRDTSPLVLDRRMQVDCEESLHDLEVGIVQPPFGTKP